MLTEFKYITTLIITISSASLLVGCEAPEVEDRGEIIKPVKTLVVDTPDIGGERRFPGRIESSRRAEVSFRVSGTLKELPVKEGDEILAGSVIAKLDGADYLTAVNDRKAVFDRASADYKRAKKLVEKGVLSRFDYDKVEADFKRSQATLKKARLDFSYTSLRAPFSGSVARRYIQNFEEVQAKQPVIALRDLTLLDVKFNVPESLMIRLKEEGVVDESDDIPVYASFDAAPGKRFWLNYKEAATRADSATQTFEVTYTLAAPQDLEVLPGMTATVNVDVSRYLGKQEIFTIPVTSVVADPGLQPKVWVIDEESMTVASRPIEVGTMQGSEIQVLSGLKGGERIVTAGAPNLVAGMKVRSLPEHEQASDNLPRTTVQSVQPAQKDNQDR